MTDAGLPLLTGLCALERLGLEATAVTDAGLRHLLDLPKLKTLILWGTVVTDDGVQELAAERPALEIKGPRVVTRRP